MAIFSGWMKNPVDQYSGSRGQCVQSYDWGLHVLWVATRMNGTPSTFAIVEANLSTQGERHQRQRMRGKLEWRKGMSGFNQARPTEIDSYVSGYIFVEERTMIWPPTVGILMAVAFCLLLELDDHGTRRKKKWTGGYKMRGSQPVRNPRSWAR